MPDLKGVTEVQGGGNHTPIEQGVHREIWISVSAIITLILIIIIVILFIKCRKYSNPTSTKSRAFKGSAKTICTSHDKFNENAFTTSALYTTAQRGESLQRPSNQLRNGGFEPRLNSSSRGQSVESTYDQHNISGGLLPIPTGHLTPKTHDRYAHLQIPNGGGGTMLHPSMTGTGTTLTRLSNGLNAAPEIGSAHQLSSGVSGGVNRVSGTESWLESSRSRETSPASSIPPGMPAFRVIPLCNGEQGIQDDVVTRPLQSDPFSHTIGATTFPSTTFGNMQQRGSSTIGSDVTSNPASDRFANYNTGMFAPMGPNSINTMRASSETASNAGEVGWSGQQAPDAPIGNSASALNLNGSSTAAPLLRRNQYWV